MSPQSLQEKNGRAGMLPLHCAAVQQRGKHAAAVVLELIRAYPQGVEEQSAAGWLPLHCAAAHQKGEHAADVITTLITAYPWALRDTTIADGFLPLHAAATHQSGDQAVTVMRMLLAAFPQAVRQKDDLIGLPLHYAVFAQSGKYAVAVITTLLQAYPAATQERDGYGSQPLHRAVCRQRGEHAAAVVLLAADPRVVHQSGEQGDLPLDHCSCNPDLPLSCAEILHDAAAGLWSPTSAGTMCIGDAGQTPSLPLGWRLFSRFGHSSSPTFCAAISSTAAWCFSLPHCPHLISYQFPISYVSFLICFYLSPSHWITPICLYDGSVWPHMTYTLCSLTGLECSLCMIVSSSSWHLPISLPRLEFLG